MHGFSDETLIRILKPEGAGISDFINRKGFYSLKILAASAIQVLLF